jgi:hypothetical protein
MVDGNRRAAEKESGRVMGGESLADLQAAMEMTDAEDMLTIERDFHGETSLGMLS